MKRALLALLAAASAFAAEPEFPLTADSKPQEGSAKGTLLKGTYTARDGSVFPGTVREYRLYLPAGFDKAEPAPFMVFQDGVIYQAPVVFDNLIAKKDIPPLVGIFIKSGVVPAANDNALPRFNRSYEYDSVTDTYSRFLIEEFLPAIEAEHGLQLSTDPNHAAIAGNSSGGICAFMAAWHRPDRFRRVFTGVGTYVGIRGADRLPVLVRKIEPKPLRVFLQSGTGDNDLYCGDWWMANQMMQRSLAWAGYDVNHAWGEGGHNQKHASQVFPDALRWLWRGWQTDMEVKANLKGESKWKGYEVVGDGEWEEVKLKDFTRSRRIICANDGTIFTIESIGKNVQLREQNPSGVFVFHMPEEQQYLWAVGLTTEARPIVNYIQCEGEGERQRCKSVFDTFGMNGLGSNLLTIDKRFIHDFVVKHDGSLIAIGDGELLSITKEGIKCLLDRNSAGVGFGERLCLSPDQTILYATNQNSSFIAVVTLGPDRRASRGQQFFELESFGQTSPVVQGLCVDTNGWLYVATSLGIQVCDQAGRVNFIIPTPKPAFDVCFGGKDLSELFIACGDTIYKRPTKAKGVVSGQQAPIKPPPPKL